MTVKTRRIVTQGGRHRQSLKEVQLRAHLLPSKYVGLQLGLAIVHREEFGPAVKFCFGTPIKQSMHG